MTAAGSCLLLALIAAPARAEPPFTSSQNAALLNLVKRLDDPSSTSSAIDLAQTMTPSGRFEPGSFP